MDATQNTRPERRRSKRDRPRQIESGTPRAGVKDTGGGVAKGSRP